MACDGGDHLIEGEAGWQPGGLVEGEELENRRELAKAWP
jgi:hypothetical protein